MEGRKKTVESMMFSAGVFIGRRLIGDVKEMGLKWGRMVKSHRDANRDKLHILKNEASTITTLITNECMLLTPKRIRKFLIEQEAKVIEDTIDIFSKHIGEITRNAIDGISENFGAGLGKEYNSLLLENTHKAMKSSPKGIISFHKNIVDKSESISSLWFDEEYRKFRNSVDKEFDELYLPETDILCNNLNELMRSRVHKRFAKLVSNITRKLINEMSELEYHEFTFECMIGSYHDGIFSEYNESSLKDIFPFHLNNLLYFNDAGEIDRDAQYKRERKSFEQSIGNDLKKEEAYNSIYSELT